jgi:sporulation protein YlmC with PRC-barrel domain
MATPADGVAAGANAGAGTQAKDASAAPSDSRSEAAQNGNSPLPSAYRVSEWLGRPVRGRDGAQVGTIEDLVLDDYGRFRYVLLRSEKFTEGQADDLLIVPMGHFRYRGGEARNIVLDASPTRISEAPRFETGAMPSQPLRRWEAVIVAYWLPKNATTADVGGGGPRAPMRGEPDPRRHGGEASGGGAEDSPAEDMTVLSREKERLFRELDENADSAITQTEAQDAKAVADAFERLDTYDNGRVTRAEFALFDIAGEGERARDSAGEGAGQ